MEGEPESELRDPRGRETQLWPSASLQPLPTHTNAEYKHKCCTHPFAYIHSYTQNTWHDTSQVCINIQYIFIQSGVFSALFVVCACVFVCVGRMEAGSDPSVGSLLNSYFIFSIIQPPPFHFSIYPSILPPPPPVSSPPSLLLILHSSFSLQIQPQFICVSLQHSTITFTCVL